jgi:hypothetical protein
MFVLSFEVSSVPFCIQHCYSLVLCFIEFSKCSSSFFLKMIMFVKELFQTPLCYDSYVACSLLFA